MKFGKIFWTKKTKIMDINEAALKLKKIEIIESQIKHLQEECKDTNNIAYAEDCNKKIQELLAQL